MRVPVETGLPDVTTPRPWSRLPVPPAKLAVRVAAEPEAMGPLAVKLEMVGVDNTVTVAVAERPVATELVAVSV